MSEAGLSSRSPEARAERVERRRRQILDAAARIMYRTGYHGMSMQAVAAEAGLSTGLSYQYFASKEEILRGVVVDILEEFRHEVPAAMTSAGDNPEARIRAGFRRMVTIIDSRREATLLAYRESQTLTPEGRAELMRLEQETIEPFRHAIAEGVASGEFRGVSPELVAHNVKMLAHGWALKHWELAGHLTVRQYVDRELDLLFAAIRA